MLCNKCYNIDACHVMSCHISHVMSCVMLYHVIMLLYNIDVLTELKYRCSNRTEQNRTCYMCHVIEDVSCYVI